MGRGKSQKSLDLIDAAYAVLEEIQPTSVRSVCYQLFVRGLSPSMEKKDTNRVSKQLVYAREEEIIDWDWIVDDGREPETISTWEDPNEYIGDVLRWYRKDFWTEQPHRIEVWSEKGTVRGTLAPILDQYGVTFRVMKGFGGATAVKNGADESNKDDRPFTVLYCGDWDPSGMYMSEIDLPKRLERYGGEVEIVRVALTEQDHNLPYFDAKRTDSRHDWYVKRYGRKCWELDALSPVILRQRMEMAIVDRLDLDAWQQAAAVQRAESESMTAFLMSWNNISGRAPK